MVLTTLPETGLRGAVAVPVEVVEKPVERIVEHLRIETIQLQSSPAEGSDCAVIASRMPAPSWNR